MEEEEGKRPWWDRALDPLRHEASMFNVLLDWRLPDENGPSVCRRLAESVPRPAIVMLTGLDHPSDRDAARRAGADDFLTKGLDPDTLARRLRDLIGTGARFTRATSAPAPPVRQR